MSELIKALEFEIPLKVESINAVNSMNFREKLVHKKNQRDTAYYAMHNPMFHSPFKAVLRDMKAKLVINLTRVCPRFIDDYDNLVAGFKHIRDGIALQLERDDTERKYTTWNYSQAKGSYSVKVEIWMDL